MKKELKYIVLTLILILYPQMVGATKYIKCGNDKTIPYAVANIFSTLLLIIKIVIPIIMVIVGMISFFKVVSSNNTEDDIKKAQKKLFNDIIAAAVIFFIISIINIAVGLVAGSDNSAMQCVKCFVDSEKCETFDKSDDIKPGFIDDLEETTT